MPMLKVGRLEDKEGWKTSFQPSTVPIFQFSDPVRNEGILRKS